MKPSMTATNNAIPTTTNRSAMSRSWLGRRLQGGGDNRGSGETMVNAYTFAPQTGRLARQKWSGAGRYVLTAQGPAGMRRSTRQADQVLPARRIGLPSFSSWRPAPAGGLRGSELSHGPKAVSRGSRSTPVPSASLAAAAHSRDSRSAPRRPGSGPPTGLSALRNRDTTHRPCRNRYRLGASQAGLHPGLS
jgi:hypothetical protein